MQITLYKQSCNYRHPDGGRPFNAKYFSQAQKGVITGLFFFIFFAGFPRLEMSTLFRTTTINLFKELTSSV